MSLGSWIKKKWQSIKKSSQSSAKKAYQKKVQTDRVNSRNRTATSNYDRVRSKASPVRTSSPSRSSSGGSSYRRPGTTSWSARTTGTSQHRSGTSTKRSTGRKQGQTAWQAYVAKTISSTKKSANKSAEAAWYKAYKKTADGHWESKTNALGTKTKTRKTETSAGTLKSRDLTSEDFLKYQNASRNGNLKLDDKTAKKIGNRTAYAANRNSMARASHNFMQGMSFGDVEGGPEKYGKKARAALKDSKESVAGSIGYGLGQVAGFATGGTSGAAKSLVSGGVKAGAKAAAKTGAKSTAKKFAKNRAAEVAVETPLNIGDAIKMSKDENGKFDKKKFAQYAALNTALTGGAGAVMEGAAIKFTKKNGQELIKLQAKANKGSITKEEGQRLKKLYDKLNTAREDTASAKSGIADEAYQKGRNMVNDARLERGKAKGAQRAEAQRMAKTEAANARAQRAADQAREETQKRKNAQINERVGRYVEEVNERNRKTLNDRELVARNNGNINEGTFTDARGNNAPDVASTPQGKRANQNTAKSARKSTREKLASKTENPRAYTKEETKEINDTVDRISNMLAHGDAADARAEAEALVRKHGQIDTTERVEIPDSAATKKEFSDARNYLYNVKWHMPEGSARTLNEFYETLGTTRKELGQKLKIGKGRNTGGHKGYGVDELWGEMSEMFPEAFPKSITDEVERFKRMATVALTKSDDIPTHLTYEATDEEIESVIKELADDILRDAEGNAGSMKDVSSKDITKRVRELSQVRQKYLDDMKAVMDDTSLSEEAKDARIDELNKDIAPTEEELFSLEGQLDEVLKREQANKPTKGPDVDEMPFDESARTGGPESLDSIMGRVKDNIGAEAGQTQGMKNAVADAEERMRRAKTEQANRKVDEYVQKLKEQQEKPGNFQDDVPKKEPARGDLPDLRGMNETELKSDIKKHTKYLKNTEKKYGADSPRAKEMREHLEEAKERLEDIQHERKTGQKTRSTRDPAVKQKGAEVTLDEPRTRFGKAWRSFYRVAVDSEADIERFAKKIGGDIGRDLLAGANAFRNARNIAGSWIQTGTSTFDRQASGKSLDAIFKPLGKNKAKRADALQYSYLIHNLDRTMPQKDVDELISLQRAVNEGQELTEEQAKRLEALQKKDKPIAGMPRSKEETQKAIDALREKYAPSEMKEIENFQSEVVKYADELLQYKVDAGIVSQAEAKKLRDTYKNYIPTFTNKEFSGVVNEAMNNGVRVNKGLKAAKGADIEDELVDLYDQLAQATRSTIKHCEMNELLRTLGEAQGVKYADIDKSLSPDELLGNSLFIKEQTGKGKKAYYFDEDGKQFEVALTDEMYMGLREMTGEEKAIMLNNIVVRKMAIPMKLFKGLITDWNVLFGVRNGARDLATALTYTKDIKGYIKAYPKALKALASKDDYYKAYIAAGGEFSSLVKSGGVDGALKMLEDGKYSPLKWASDINGFIEMMPRMQEFISTIDKAGVPPKLAGRKVIDRAMRNANDVTLNFGRTGIATKMLNSAAVPYLNPSVQGLDKLVRVFTEAKNEKNMRGIIALGAKMSTFAVAPSVFNEWMLRNDEDYQQLNTRDKDNNYYIPLGKLTGALGIESKDDKGKFIKIPKARELVVAAEPFEYFYRHAQFGDSGGWRQMFKTGIDNVGVINPLTDNFVSPVIRMATNKTWFGGDIESSYEVQNLAPEDRYDETTSLIGIKLGQTALAKELKLSPKKIDNLIDSYTGVIGDYLLPATAQASKGNPILNQFITDSVFSNKLSTEAWDKYNQLEQKANSKSLSDEEKQKAEWKRQDLYNNYIGEAVTINRAVADIQGDKTLTKAEKHDLVRNLKIYMNEFYRGADTGEAPKLNGKDIDPLKAIYKVFRKSEGTKAVNRAFKYASKGYQEAWKEYKNILKGSDSSKEAKAKNRKEFLDYVVDIRTTQGAIGGGKDYIGYKTAAVVAAMNKVSGKKQDAFGIYDDTRQTAKTYKQIGYDLEHYVLTEHANFVASRNVGLEKQSDMQSHDIAMAQAVRKHDDGSYFIGDSKPYYQKGRMPAARYLVNTNKKQWTTKEIHNFADKYDFDYSSDYDKVYEQARKTYKGFSDLECAAVAQVITNKGYNDFGDTSLEYDSGIMGSVTGGGSYGGYGGYRRGGYRRYGRRGGGGGGGGGGAAGVDWNTYATGIFASKEPTKSSTSSKTKAYTSSYKSVNGSQKVTDFTKKSELTEAYRRRVQKKQMITKK